MELYQRASMWKKCALRAVDCYLPTNHVSTCARAWTESCQAQRERRSVRQATERSEHVRERLCVQAAAPWKLWWHELLSAEAPLKAALATTACGGPGFDPCGFPRVEA